MLAQNRRDFPASFFDALQRLTYTTICLSVQPHSPKNPPYPPNAGGTFNADSSKFRLGVFVTRQRRAQLKPEQQRFFNLYPGSFE
ncbi:hypothetical protein FQZ97_1049390 [compost metagenome]